jgi:hypothetical protein
MLVALSVMPKKKVDRIPSTCGHSAFPMMLSAIFSAIIVIGALVGPRTICGIAEPSMTRRPTRSRVTLETIAPLSDDPTVNLPALAG